MTMVAITTMTPAAAASPTSKARNASQIDEIGKVGGGLTGPALGHHEDRVEGLQDEDGAEHHGELDELAQMRQRDPPERLPAGGTVHPRRLEDLRRLALQPARMISIMNGVHCQVSTMMIDSIGYSVSQSTWPTPKGDRNQFIRPKTGFTSRSSTASAAAVGITRNGVMSSVRDDAAADELLVEHHGEGRPMIMHSRTHWTVSTRCSHGVAEKLVGEDLGVVCQPDELPVPGRSRLHCWKL